jgi:nickel-dependent lactate racemase
MSSGARDGETRRETADRRRDALRQLEDLDATLTMLGERAVAAGSAVDRLAVVEPPPVDLDAALADALARPLGTPPLAELARGARSAAIITSDATRAVPTARLLDPTLGALLGAGVPLEGIDLIVGTGAHRAATVAEEAAMLGPRWAGRLRVSSHDPRAADLVDVGALPDGTRLRIDRRVAEADVRVAFGQVEPHEFAGFTGGRKAVLPAVADYQATARNHRLERLLHPAVRSGVLGGNPIHEEMVRAARLARLDFIVNVVLDRDLRPLAVAAGDVEAAHEELVAFVRGYAGLPRPFPPGEPPDIIVIGPGEPLAINLYQSVKALVGVEPLLAPLPTEDVAAAGDMAVGAGRGAAGRRPVVVLLSRCWDGTGSEEMLDPFRKGGADVIAHLEEEYTIEKDHSYFIARVNAHGSPIIACCPGVADADLEVLGWRPAADPVAAFDLAVALAVGESGPHDRGPSAAGGPGAAGVPAGAGVSTRRVLLFPRPQRTLLAAEP